MAQMLLCHHGNLVILPKHKIRARRDASANAHCKRQIIRVSQGDLKLKRQHTDDEGSIERIRERFRKLELSVSSYDTAWVAMVPSNSGLPIQQQQPCFPGCLQWVMENQKADGSWGLDPSHPSLVKESLSSTLACVLALQKWKVGEQLVQKGLHFIGSNRLVVDDKTQISPMGFDIVFPGMISYAQDLGLNLPLDSAFLDRMHYHLDLNIQRGKGNSTLAYFAEGLGESYDWEEMIKEEQRSNGSLFNSPSTTAAALIHLRNDKCFHYLQSLLKTYGNAVPTIYPCDTYARLCMIDTLERLGIARYFRYEIDIILDETHRCWQQRNEEIFMDAACCALAFRLLRMYGYEAASNSLEELVDQEHFFNTASPQCRNTNTIIELYKASGIKILEEEPVLENLNSWTHTFLKHQLSNQEFCDDQLRKEVEYALDYSIDSLDRLAHRRGIELYDPNRIRMLKTSYRFCSIDNMDVLEFSIHDYNKCQAILHEEVDQFEKWVKNSRLSGLKFDWHILISSYFLIAAVHFSPQEADARAAWTKASFIGTIIDDLFDVDGSREELLNITELVDKWNEHSSVSYCSERIEILFSAVQESVDYFVSKAFIAQGRYIKHELIKIWLDFVKCMLREVEWWKEMSTPSMEEYLTNGCETIGIGLFATAFYFLGEEFSQDTLTSQEYKSLYQHVGMITRLFNDYQGLERDKVQRKMNSCWLLMEHSNGAITEDEARAEVRKMIENSKREALRMLLQKEGSVIPRAIKDSLFKISKIGHYLYGSGDEYRCPGKTLDDIKAVLYDPIKTPNISSPPLPPREKKTKEQQY